MASMGDDGDENGMMVRRELAKVITRRSGGRKEKEKYGTTRDGDLHTEL